MEEREGGDGGDEDNGGDDCNEGSPNGDVEDERNPKSKVSKLYPSLCGDDAGGGEGSWIASKVVGSIKYFDGGDASDDDNGRGEGDRMGGSHAAAGNVVGISSDGDNSKVNIAKISSSSSSSSSACLNSEESEKGGDKDEEDIEEDSDNDNDRT
ncbi:hypothetical protein CPB84DRAFT_1752633 [Gymnopilus junonius]|uniref:Uncharacterized protein n=1 Tax=Gymnopilus junonius TaxID=109634 RepID=A0A9P5N9K3_GYMJU|nr:hypothetical protein CPB84DRAFT_1752633 [Gymnopilus junonius]